MTIDQGKRNDQAYFVSPVMNRGTPESTKSGQFDYLALSLAVENGFRQATYLGTLFTISISEAIRVRFPT